MKKYDVIIVGGGTAGMVAGIASGRAGAKTLVLERNGYLGGTASTGIPFLGFFSGDGTKVVGGIPQEIVDNLVASGGSMGHMRGGAWRYNVDSNPYEYSLTPFDPESLKLVVQEMALNAGVDLVYQTHLIDAVREENKITSIKAMTVSGPEFFEAPQFVDATGDAFLAAMAGFPTAMRGRGNMQNVTSIIRVGGIDTEKMYQQLMNEEGILGKNEWHTRIVRGKYTGGGEGIIHMAGHAIAFPSEKPLTFTGVAWRSDEMCFNISRTINIDPIDSDDINKAEICERQNVHKIVAGLKENVGGFENSYLISSSPWVGIREGRRIRGSYTLTEDEVLGGSEFDDAIARGAYPIDIHDPAGGRTQFHFIKGGKSYGIPYGCLVPEGSDNLLVAGRCVSTTGKALGSVRLMACCMAMGQAAGTAAALAFSENKKVMDVSIKELRKNLIKDGAILSV